MRTTSLNGVSDAAPLAQTPRTTAAPTGASEQLATSPSPAAASPVAQALQQAAAVQGALAPLFADLAAALQASALPASLQAAAADLLSAQLPLDPPPTAQALEQAVAGSGLFLEADLASAGAPAPGDLKAALLTLRAALQDAAGTPATATSSAEARPQPPYREGPTLAQPEVAATLLPDLPLSALLARLSGQTRAALARGVLMQAASRRGTQGGASATGGRSWLFELPFATARGAATAQFEIDADDEARTGDERPRTWRTRFAFDAAPIGPVHARISLTGDQARVTLWAERPDTLAQLTAHSEDLAAGLADEAFSAQVSILPGAPETAGPPPAPGAFVSRSA